MSSNGTDSRTRPSAEAAYREAFERLKRGAPERLPKGTPVSQNNVAREAGCDPSALKKARFPTLIADIQCNVSEHAGDRPPSRRQAIQSQRKRNGILQDRIKILKEQRDSVTCQLNEANSTILDLMERIAELEARCPSNQTLISRR